MWTSTRSPDECETGTSSYFLWRRHRSQVIVDIISYQMYMIGNRPAYTRLWDDSDERQSDAINLCRVYIPHLLGDILGRDLRHVSDEY